MLAVSVIIKLASRIPTDREKEKDEPVWVKEDKILSAEKRTILSNRHLYTSHSNYERKV